jgi:hypothetical protein
VSAIILLTHGLFGSLVAVALIIAVVLIVFVVLGRAQHDLAGAVAVG